MSLAFSATVKAFAAFSIAATTAYGQVNGLIDETAITACHFNNLNNLKTFHEWDLEFEGYTSQGKYQV